MGRPLSPVQVPVGNGRRVSVAPLELLVVAEDDRGPVAMQLGVHVRLDAGMDAALRLEGLAREFVHALQVHRKSKRFAVTDRVRVAWKADGDLAAAIRAHEGYVREEVLATEMKEAPGLAGGDALDVDGSVARVEMEKA